MQASSELRARALVVHERLCAEYGCPIPYFHDLDPLSELVSSLLSHRTKNRDSGRAFRQLRERFATWEAVRDARDWLESLTGVGPKTSAAVLLFSRLRMPALPVDSHHHRVAQRLALIPENISVGPAHRLLEAQLPPDWTAQQVYDNHEALMLHGQRCCYFRNPDCHRCAVLDLCPYGQRRMAALPAA
ncbi:MAG: Fe-S cluster assembly protein HesB [Gemmatimonadetes bacterium]|nr:Fe-S cluster assembly protein HesB [Gemmatimonadota bacterium]